MTDYTTAIDSIFAFFMAAWNADTLAVLDEAPAIRWQGKEEATLPDPSKYWVRISQQSIDELQKTYTAENSKKRFENNGIVFLQIFCPKTESNSFYIGRQLAAIGKSIFRGKSTSAGVWFRNVRIKELSSEESFHRFNVVAEYQFDEME